MRVPDMVLERLKLALWQQADELRWSSLPAQERSAQYERWISSPEVGGVLSRYLDPPNIRVYLKDTVMKPYARQRTQQAGPIMRLLEIDASAPIAEAYVKPHGRRLRDGRVICWGFARDWKSVLIAAYERAYFVADAVPHAVVMLPSPGKYQQADYRQMVANAATALGIERLLWKD